MRRKIKKNDIVKEFAWFPIRVGNDVRWLETVYIHYSSYISSSWGVLWTKVRFVTKEEYLEYKKTGIISGCRRRHRDYDYCNEKNCSHCNNFTL